MEPLPAIVTLACSISIPSEKSIPNRLHSGLKPRIHRVSCRSLQYVSPRREKAPAKTLDLRRLSPNHICSVSRFPTASNSQSRLHRAEHQSREADASPRHSSPGKTQTMHQDLLPAQRKPHARCLMRLRRRLRFHDGLFIYPCLEEEKRQDDAQGDSKC